jgi:hypothetical protein
LRPSPLGRGLSLSGDFGTRALPSASIGVYRRFHAGKENARPPRLRLRATLLHDNPFLHGRIIIPQTADQVNSAAD